MTENIIDGTGKAASAAARRQREEVERQQKDRCLIV